MYFIGELSDRTYRLGSVTIKTKCVKLNLECRARPDLPEIRLFWTSTWGEEDRVLVDPAPSMDACIRLDARDFWGYFVIK